MIYRNEKLSKYNWFNLGGPADIFFRPENKDQLINFLSEIKKNKYKMHILGAGSNTLIRDSGVKGAVIKLGSKFSEIKLLEKDTIEVGAAILDRKVADKRIYPAVDITRSGTRREELLFKKEDLTKMNVLRRIISPMGTMDGIEFLISKLKNTKNNADFFISMNKPN